MRQRRRRSALRPAAALAVLLACVACARPAAAAAPRITVYVIEASNQPGGVDREVRHIYKRLGGTLGFSTFRLISKVQSVIPFGREKVVPVAGGRQLVITPKSVTGDRLSVEVEIRKRGGAPMRVSGRLVRGGTFIVGGYQYGPGRLVFAISADF